MSEEQQPNEVEPTDYDTRRDSDEDSEYEGDQALRFKISRPTHEDFNYPVHTGDK